MNIFIIEQMTIYIEGKKKFEQQFFLNVSIFKDAKKKIMSQTIISSLKEREKLIITT